MTKNKREMASNVIFFCCKKKKNRQLIKAFHVQKSPLACDLRLVVTVFIFSSTDLATGKLSVIKVRRKINCTK